MPLESATYISDLVTTNPDGTDAKSSGDNHIRLLKSTLQATFPNINGPIVVTDEALDLAAGSDTNQAGSIVAGTGWGKLSDLHLYKLNSKWALIGGRVWVTGAALLSDIITLPAGYRPVDSDHALSGIGIFYDASTNLQYGIRLVATTIGVVSGYNPGAANSGVSGTIPTPAVGDVIAFCIPPFRIA